MKGVSPGNSYNAMFGEKKYKYFIKLEVVTALVGGRYTAGSSETTEIFSGDELHLLSGGGGSGRGSSR